MKDKAKDNLSVPKFNFCLNISIENVIYSNYEWRRMEALSSKVKSNFCCVILENINHFRNYVKKSLTIVQNLFMMDGVYVKSYMRLFLKKKIQRKCLEFYFLTNAINAINENHNFSSTNQIIINNNDNSNTSHQIK